MQTRVKTIFRLGTPAVVFTSLAVAVGCGSGAQGPGGGATSTGGVGNVSGGSGNTSGGGGNVASGGNSAGGSVQTSGGAGNTSTGGSSSGGSGNNSTGGNSTGGTGNNSSGGAANGSGGAGGGSKDDPLPSMGCGKAAPAAGRASIDVDGLMREYILALPDGYDPAKAYKLIFTWHPWGGSAQQVAGSGANGYYVLAGASKGEAILVSPEGLDFNGQGLGWGNKDGQDIAFMEAMVARFDAELCFDHNRVFSTGFSFGGMMSNAVACSGLARAVAPMAGNSMVSGCAQGTKPVAYMGFHGVDDTVVSIAGGETARDVFVERNGCGAAKPSDSNWCELVDSKYQPCECTTYEGCADGYPVTWCEYKGPHMVAPTSSQTIWDFFAQF